MASPRVDVAPAQAATTLPPALPPTSQLLSVGRGAPGSPAGRAGVAVTTATPAAPPPPPGRLDNTPASCFRPTPAHLAPSASAAAPPQPPATSPLRVRAPPPPPLAIGTSAPGGFVRWQPHSSGAGAAAAAAHHAASHPHPPPPHHAASGAGGDGGASPGMAASGMEDDDDVAAGLLVLQSSPRAVAGSPPHGGFSGGGGGASLSGGGGHGGAVHAHSGGLAGTPRRKRAAPDPSKYRGVVERTGGLFRARVYHNKECTLSDEQFATPDEAAHEYDRMALRIKGAAAELNFPELHGRAAAGVPPAGGTTSGAEQQQQQPSSEQQQHHAAAHAPAAPAGSSRGDAGAGGEHAHAHAPTMPAALHAVLHPHAAAHVRGRSSGTARATAAAAAALGMLSGSGGEEDGAAPMIGTTASAQQHPQQQQQMMLQPLKRRRSAPRADGALLASMPAAGSHGGTAGAAPDAHMAFVSAAEAFLDAPLQVSLFLEAHGLAPGAAAAAAWGAECRARVAARAGGDAAAACAAFAARFLDDGDAAMEEDEAAGEACVRTYIEALRRSYPGLILEPYILSAAALADADDGGIGAGADARDAGTMLPGARAARRRAAAALAALRCGARRPVVFLSAGAGAIAATTPLDAALAADADAGADADAALEAALPRALRAARPDSAPALLALLAPSASPACAAARLPHWSPRNDAPSAAVCGFPAASACALRRLDAGAGAMLIAPLATAAASARLDAIHTALLGATAEASQAPLLPLEAYLEESLPLCLHLRDRAAADVAELPAGARVAAVSWRAARAARRVAVGLRGAELVTAYLLSKSALADGGGGGDAVGDDVAAEARDGWGDWARNAAGLPREPAASAARAAWPRDTRPWAASAPPASPWAAEVPMAAVVVRTAEQLSDALTASDVAPACALRPGIARATLRALRPALLDLLQLAPPEASPLDEAMLQQQAHGYGDETAAAAAAATALLAALSAAAAPFSREYIAAALADADVALRRSSGGASSEDEDDAADAAAAGLCWLQRYLEAPPGSMMRAALVTAAQEAPLAAHDVASDVRERWHLALQLQWEASNAVRLAAAGAAFAPPGAPPGEAAAAAAFAAAALRAARGWREALERAADAAAAGAFAAHRDDWGGRSHVAPPALLPPWRGGGAAMM